MSTNNEAFNMLPEYININYGNHSIGRSLERNIINKIPHKIKKSDNNFVIVKSYWVNNGHTLDKIIIQVDVGLKNNMVIEIAYIPSAKFAKTVYKTKRKAKFWR